MRVESVCSKNGATMFSRGLFVVFLAFAIGCGIPYKDEYDAAMRAKEEADRIAAEALAAAEQAKNALTEEQNALKRLYTDD